MAKLSCGIIVCGLLALSLSSLSVQGRSWRRRDRTKASTVKLTVSSTSTLDNKVVSMIFLITGRVLPERNQINDEDEHKWSKILTKGRIASLSPLEAANLFVQPRLHLMHGFLGPP